MNKRLWIVVGLGASILTGRADLASDVASWTNGVYLTVVGDSIGEGYNHYTTYGAGGPTGDTAYSLGHLLYAKSGGVVTATNFALPNRKWSQIVSEELPRVWSAGAPKYLLPHCGVNDAYVGVTWESVLADMNITLAACKAHGTTMLLDEIFPASTSTASNAAVIRTWNTNYHAWAATNGVVMITDTVNAQHAAFGQLRASTGYPDDLKAAFNIYDGVHLTTQAYSDWADIILARLTELSADPPPDETGTNVVRMVIDGWVSIEWGSVE